jgi:hypothetical protein
LPPTIHIGSILLEQQLQGATVLGLESEPYSGNWRLAALDSFAIDRKVHAAGWNFFFLASEVNVTFLGAVGAKKVGEALQRILAKVRHQNFNGLEVTRIVVKRFFGVPYTTVSAHSRHIQQSCCLDDAEHRLATQHATTSAQA